MTIQKEKKSRTLIHTIDTNTLTYLPTLLSIIPHHKPPSIFYSSIICKVSG